MKNTPKLLYDPTGLSKFASVGYKVIEPDDEGTIKDYIDAEDRYMYTEKEKYHKLIDSIKK